MTNEEITHKKAIETLKRISYEYDSHEEVEAIKYVINQLNQCEVFDEPIEMEVYSYDSKIDSMLWIKRYVFGIFKGLYIVNAILSVEDLNSSEFYHKARLIKKDPLSFGEWCLKNETVSFHNGTSERINKTYNNYQEYLKPFND